MDNQEQFNLIKDILSGNKEKYRFLVDSCSGEIFAFINSMIKDYSIAEDIAQEVFIKGYFSLKTFKHQSSFKSWIYKIAYNETLTYLRKQKKLKNIKFIDDIDYTSNDLTFLFDNSQEDHLKKLEDEKHLTLLKTFINNLLPDTSLLINMFYFQNKSIKEIAFITSQSESNVKVKLHRVKNSLRQEFIKYGNK